MIVRSIIHCFFIIIWYYSVPILGVDDDTVTPLIQKKIAICVSGQIGRWIPETMIKYLLEYNEDYEFTLFFNLQYTNVNSTSIFSTDAKISFQPTKFTTMQQAEIFDYFHTLINHLNNTKIASFTFVPNKPLEEWQNLFQGRPPYVIVQYSLTQHVILNFYSHQVRCIHQIKEYEEMTQSFFQYVLQTREDIYYFQGVSLPFLLSHLKDVENIPPDPLKCDFITKDCLQWGGINMRWQLMTRNASKLVMGKRIDYYRSLLDQNQTAYNPEQYELQQLKHYKIRICEFLSEKIPNAVGRHVRDDEICFIKPETIDHCIPSDNMTFVEKHSCSKVPKRFRNNKIVNR